MKDSLVVEFDQFLQSHNGCFPNERPCKNCAITFARTAIASAVKAERERIADELDEQILSSASTSPHLDLAYYVKKLREDERVGAPGTKGDWSNFVCDHCNRNCGGYHLER